VIALRFPDLCLADLSAADRVSADRGPAHPGRADRGGAGLTGAAERALARLFERAVAAVTEFCPRVEVVEPGVCAFGARGPARYFGGETIVARRIVEAVGELGLECRAGIADGLFAALLAARGTALAPDRDRDRELDEDGDRAGDAITFVPPGLSTEFLGRQPVSVLGEPDLAGLLHRLGIRTLGDLAALPAHDVASRFGKSGERAHALASGLDERPLAAQSPASDLSVGQEFDPPELSAEPLVFAAKALAEQMHAKLNAKGLTCVRVQVQASWADGRESSRLWRHDGLLTSVQVADRVRWQLDGWRADSPDTENNPDTDNNPDSDDGPDAETARQDGVTLLRLIPDQVVQAAGQQLALWGEAVVTDRVARAAMRVQAILGHDAVLRPLLSGGRNFAEQVTHCPFGEKAEPRFARDQPWPGQVPGAAPACVFPVPREATVTDDRGQAVTVSGRCVVSATPVMLTVSKEPSRAITGWTGPWPLAERWWDPAQAQRRARFQLVTDDGRAWLAAVRDGRWQIEAGYW
jgi:protein ImuB